MPVVSRTPHKLGETSSFTYNNFRGMNRLSDRLNMSPEFAWDIQNGYIRKDIKSGLGIIKQRMGTSEFNSVGFTNKCRYIYEPKWDGGSVDVFIREGTRWAKFDGTNTFDDLDTGRASDVRGQAAMFANQVILVDSGTPRKCTAGYAVSDLSSDGSMPTDSTAVHVHDHKVWLNSAANPMKAYYSKSDSANASDSWSAANDAGSLDFSHILPRGDTLIGFATFAEKFLVFIFRKYVVVYSAGTDPSEFALQQVLPLNCISWHGIAQVGNDLAVPSLEGVNSFRSSLTNQDLDIDDLTKFIAPLYREIIGELSDVSEVSAGFSHKLNHYYICAPTATHQVLVYSLDIKNFVGRWTGFNAWSFCERQDGTMLIGGTGTVYTLNSGTSDDGSAISFQYDFPYLYFKDPNRNKAPREMEGLIKHENDLSLIVDYWYATNTPEANKISKTISLSADAALYRSALYRDAYYRSTGNTRFQTRDIIGRGKQMAMSLRHSTLDAAVEIPYWIIRVRYEGEKIR